MAIEIRVPALGESVTEAIVGQCYKKDGEIVKAGESLIELETEKVSIDVPVPVAGKLTKIFIKEGDVVTVDSLLALVIEEAVGNASDTADSPLEERPIIMHPAPSAAKLIAENNLNTRQMRGSGKRGQILKEDVLETLSKENSSNSKASLNESILGTSESDRETRVRMTRLRQTIASRLKDAQNTAAMLTTFNEVDMFTIIKLRNRYRDLFEKKHGVKLGFMGFFTKAVCQALKEIPALNAEIDGTEIIYRKYAHIGVAVATTKGLVVPVVRDADRISIADIEKEINRLSRLARDGKLSIADMQDGTFTITNGGIYGSLMSTPILNAPQSGILGMHAIKERPMALDGQIIIRPMMYLAVSYDHRLVDGQEAVTFLVRVKENLEDPERLILNL